MSAFNIYLHDLRGRLVSQKQDIVNELAKASPAWFVVIWNKVAEAPLEKWATAVAIVYGLLQIYFLVRDRRRTRRARK
jgi:hypothetical protein